MIALHNFDINLDELVKIMPYNASYTEKNISL